MSFIFSSLTLCVCVQISLGLSCLEFSQLLKTVGVFDKFEMFSAVISSRTFTALFFLFFWDPEDTFVKSLLLSHSFVRLFSFFSLCLNWVFSVAL